MFNFLKKIKHLEHYALWGFMFLFVFDYHFWEGNWMEAIVSTSLEVLFYMAVFYLNYLVAIPYFLKKKQRVLYVLVLLTFFVVYVFIIKISGLETQLYESGYWRNLFSMGLNFSLFFLISTLYWHYQQVQKERELQLKMKTKKLEAEMKFLKNQISPHFIFNTLNNIYSLVQQGHTNAAPMLAKLSAILRYLLYDSAKEKVFLKKELDTIQEYIALQLLRKPKSQNIDFYIEGAANHLKITPLILLNFVENCFKHNNIETSEEAWIKISGVITGDKQLIFQAENSKGNTLKKSTESGLGNENIRRQLELNYPKTHQLEVIEEKDFYSVKVILELT